MKIIINTENKTIQLEQDIELGKLIKELKSLGINIKEYKLLESKAYPYPATWGTYSVYCNTITNSDALTTDTLTIN